MRPKRLHPVALVLAMVFLLQGKFRCKTWIYNVLRIKKWLNGKSMAEAFTARSARSILTKPVQRRRKRPAVRYLHVEQQKRVYAYRDYFVAPIILPSSIGRVSVNS